jgi:hypothetical protein
MNPSHTLASLALCLAVAAAGAARAGAPQPDQRQGDFVHVCRGGANKAQACTVATEEADCPGSECVVQPLSSSIRGTLTLIAHDAVTDWANGGATHQALTVMLEVRAPGGGTQILAATYQDLGAPTNPPRALDDVVSIDMDEFALRDITTAVNALLFVQPESTLAQQLQTLFGSSGTPAIVAVSDRRVQSADHTLDGLATVLRFKVTIQFLAPV